MIDDDDWRQATVPALESLAVSSRALFNLVPSLKSHGECKRCGATYFAFGALQLHSRIGYCNGVTPRPAARPSASTPRAPQPAAQDEPLTGGTEPTPVGVNATP